MPVIDEVWVLSQSMAKFLVSFVLLVLICENPKCQGVKILIIDWGIKDSLLNAFLNAYRYGGVEIH